MSSFPTLSITAKQLTPRGSFAEAQAAYLSPDERTIDELVALCRDKNVGIVAHYYMDAELQGVLTRLPDAYVTIADSLQLPGNGYGSPTVWGKPGGAAIMLPSGDNQDEGGVLPLEMGCDGELLLLIGSTSSAPAVRSLAERLATETQGRVRVVDCPVSGGVDGAEAGSLSIMLGGSASCAAMSS